jgi:cell division inhibitor SulA/protein ImuA
MQTATVEELRQYLSRTAPFYGEREGKKSGLDTLDHLLGGGLPKGGLTILTGDRGAGRLTIAARIAAEETKASRPIAWVDAKGTLYPPALAAAGVELERVLMVKSEDERIVYAAEQIVSSGAFHLVVATGLDNLLNPSRARRLQTSAEGQNVSVLLVLEPNAASRITNAALKLSLSRRGRGIMIEVEKDRTGTATGRKAMLA